jgi:hypothetical protein
MVPNHSRVVEFGAGNRVLERYLDSSCTYTPSDIVDRGSGTIVCDLNQRPLPAVGDYDVAVFMGVLEYLRDVPSVLDWLANQFRVCVVSYACADGAGRPLRGVVESIGRLQHGWMNNYHDEEIRSLFRDRGFDCLSEDNWEDQRLYLFSQRA